MSIEIKNLFHIYNPKSDIEARALNGIDLSLEDHFFAALIGKTGSGKSTLAQHLNFLLKPNDGTIDFESFHISSIKKEQRRLKVKELRKNVGYLFQFSENQLFAETVLKDVSFGPLNFGYSEKEAKEMAIEALKKVGIAEILHERSPFELSGGEKRRVAIAGVIAYKPKLLILDEPTAGLDSVGKTNLLKLLKDIYNEGISILLITHDMDVVLESCDRVIELEDGKIINNLETLEFFNKNLDNKNYVIPEILRFCSEFDDKIIKNCRTFEELKEKLFHE